MMDSQSKNENGGWVEWAKYVLLTLEQHDEKIEKLKDCQSAEKLEFREFRTEIKTKAGNISAIISILVTIATSVIIYFITK